MTFLVILTTPSHPHSAFQVTVSPVPFVKKIQPQKNSWTVTQGGPPPCPHPLVMPMDSVYPPVS